MLKGVFAAAGMLVACNVVFAGEQAAGPGIADILRQADASKAELFAMCCWAEGRNGFQHCTEYGVCVGNADKTCIGRGPSEGMQLSCAESRDDRPKGRP